MGTITNLALCALVLLICSSDIRAQSTTVGPARNQSEVVTTAPSHNSTAPVSSNSSQPNVTLTPPQTHAASSISSSTVRAPPASTPQPTPQDNAAFPNQTATALPGTAGSGNSSTPANGTISEEATSNPGVNTKPTTNSLNISSPRPASTSPTASVAHSSAAPPTPPPNVPNEPTSTSGPRTSSAAPATPPPNVPNEPSSTSSPAPATPPPHVPNEPTSTSSAVPVSPHNDAPSELNVGDDNVPSHNAKAPLDPLLAGLVSVFIVSAAVVVLLLFLKFRRRNEGPEFRRLQDLPMDDMMEDTPLSMFTY